MKLIILEDNQRINADMIESYRPSAKDPNKTVIDFARTGAQLVVDVPAEQLDKHIKDTGEHNVSQLTSVVRRLIESLDRLTVHIPTSIRMHM